MKQSNQYFALGVLGIIVVGILLYLEKLTRVTIEADKIEIKDLEQNTSPSETAQPKTAQNDAASSIQIKVGNNEETAGHVQVGKDQTITDSNFEPPAEPKSPSPPPASGNTSISVRNIKGTIGNVQVGNGQTISETQP